MQRLVRGRRSAEGALADAEGGLPGIAGGPDPHGARLVEACDKLANLRDIVEDVRAEGPETLERFRGGREGTRWYYQQIGQLLMPQVPRVAAAYDPLLAQFDALLESD